MQRGEKCYFFEDCGVFERAPGVATHRIQSSPGRRLPAQLVWRAALSLFCESKGRSSRLRVVRLSLGAFIRAA